MNPILRSPQQNVFEKRRKKPHNGRISFGRRVCRIAEVKLRQSKLMYWQTMIAIWLKKGAHEQDRNAKAKAKYTVRALHRFASAERRMQYIRCCIAYGTRFFYLFLSQFTYIIFFLARNTQLQCQTLFAWEKYEMVFIFPLIVVVIVMHFICTTEKERETHIQKEKTEEKKRRKTRTKVSQLLLLLIVYSAISFLRFKWWPCVCNWKVKFHPKGNKS